MSITEKILLLIFIISHSFLNIYTRNRINESSYLNDYQKKIHNIIIWILPYLWAMFILRLIKPDEYRPITKKDRKIKQNNFYESRKGFHGG